MAVWAGMSWTLAQRVWWYANKVGSQHSIVVSSVARGAHIGNISASLSWELRQLA